MCNLYNIPAHLPFSDTLAAWVLERYNSSPLELSRVLMLLPSRRACLALRDAFLRASNGKPLLLPRMQPIGDVDENMLLAYTAQTALVPTDGFELKRLFILARLIEKKNGWRMDHALKLAEELARLLDELEREQVDVAALANLVPEDFAEHWQVTAEFLKIISEHWPEIVKEQGIISPVSYRNQTLAELSEHWKETSPQYPIIVAGTTGSIPASAELIATVATLPRGMIVLPGFDTTVDRDYFKHLDETHAQWGMHRLVNKLKADIEDIITIGDVPGNERTKLLSEIMRPAGLSEAWQSLALKSDKAVAGMKRIVCRNIQEEASVIALLLREILEQQGKSAALVTHDRTLARQVCAIIERFDVTVDDTAGKPLTQTPLATFLRLIAETAADGVDAITLLTLLKHPMAHAGMGRAECLEITREYEKFVLRSSKGDAETSARIRKLKDNVEKMFAPFMAVLSNASLSAMARAHIVCAEQLAGNGLWDAPEAKDISEFLSELRDTSQLYDIRAAGRNYPEIFETLLSGRVFRAEYGTHPRLKILSPIEARMQHFDRIILGGLNEESWPSAASADPWLNRPMRASVGLPSPERAIGLAAHDFFALASAPEVYLTRAEKVSGAPATPSRWLVKLDALLAKFPAAEPIDDGIWRVMVSQLDAQETVQAMSRPEPCPPLAARPKSLSVTQIDTLVRNPYVTYVDHILHLRMLKPVMREPDSSDFGTAVHKAIEDFVKEYPEALPKNAYEKLLRYGQQALEPFLGNVRVRTLWWPRFERIARFIIASEVERRRTIKRVVAETTGSRAIDGFTITGRADRIEEYKDGSVAIIDYKTGRAPADSHIKRGLASQLTLLAFIMETQIAGNITSLEYWQLRGGEEGGEIKSIDTSYIQAASTMLQELIAQYNNADFPYLWKQLPEFLNQYQDYEHLARVKEWAQ